MKVVNDVYAGIARTLLWSKRGIPVRNEFDVAHGVVDTLRPALRDMELMLSRDMIAIREIDYEKY